MTERQATDVPSSLRELLQQARPGDVDDAILDEIRTAMRRSGVTGELEGHFASCLVECVKEMLSEAALTERAACIAAIETADEGYEEDGWRTWACAAIRALK